MSTFKTDYSSYRKRLSEAISYGNSEDFKNVLKSNILFFEISSKEEKPVSKKIFLYKNHRDIYNEFYKNRKQW